MPTREFYGSLADRVFRSTQYVRHHSVPFYTPEPDIIHEIIGHANMLGNPVFADLYELAGQASQRAETDAALDFFSKVFWFTLEFGVVWEDGELRAYGAGLLSSYGEIEEFRRAEVRPWDLAQMGTLDYDITRYQPVLFAAESFDRMVDDLGAFFAGYDDEDHAPPRRASERLTGPSGPHVADRRHLAAERTGRQGAPVTEPSIAHPATTIDQLFAANARYADTFDGARRRAPTSRRPGRPGTRRSSAAWTPASTCSRCSACGSASRTSSATRAASPPTTCCARWRCRSASSARAR